MDESNTAKMTYNNCAVVDAKIEDLAKLINIVRDYENPFQYIVFMDSDTSKHITAEITPGLLTLSNEVIQNQISRYGYKSNLIQAITTKYSILDHSKKYKLTQDIPIETKLNILYAERLKYARNYCENILPPKYATIFRENWHRNIYEKVKVELLEELNTLVSQKIELLAGF